MGGQGGRWGECEVEVRRGGRVVGWVWFRGRSRGGGRAFPPTTTPNEGFEFF